MASVLLFFYNYQGWVRVLIVFLAACTAILVLFGSFKNDGSSSVRSVLFSSLTAAAKEAQTLIAQSHSDDNITHLLTEVAGGNRATWRVVIFNTPLANLSVYLITFARISPALQRSAISFCNRPPPCVTMYRGAFVIRPTSARMLCTVCRPN